jgi:2-dehydropantoate 2-reductase
MGRGGPGNARPAREGLGVIAMPVPVRGPILIWGAGAIGGTLGAYFVQAGHQVVFVDRAADHVEAINTQGLRLEGPIQEFTVQARAFTPEQLQGKFGTVFLCVKAHHTLEAIRALEPHLTSDGFVVSAQNGLNELEISGVIGESRTVGCFVNFGADYLEAGLIHYAGRGAVVIGELDGKITPRLKTLHKLMLEFDDRAICTTNIWGYLWGKMAYGAQLFVTALTNESIADALAAAEHRNLFTEVAREVMHIAAARGVTPEGFNGFNPHAFTPNASLEDANRSLEEMVAFNRKSAKTHSGIWRDLAVRKRQTEVDAQLGPIVALGAEVGVDAPITARLIEMIHEIEAGTRALHWANLAELEKEMR